MESSSKIANALISLEHAYEAVVAERDEARKAVMDLRLKLGATDKTVCSAPVVKPPDIASIQRVREEWDTANFPESWRDYLGADVTAYQFWLESRVAATLQQPASPIKIMTSGMRV